MLDHRTGRSACASLVIASVLVLVAAAMAIAQEPAAGPPSPPLPPPLPVPGTTADPADDASPAKLLERLRKMERTIEDLNNRNQQLQDKYDQLSKDVAKSKKGTADDLGPGESKSYLDPLPPGMAGAPENRERTAESGGGATRAAQQQVVGNRRLGRIQLRSFYNYAREGFELSTEDDELNLKIRLLGQVDAKYFETVFRDSRHRRLLCQPGTHVLRRVYHQAHRVPVVLPGELRHIQFAQHVFELQL